MSRTCDKYNQMPCYARGVADYHARTAAHKKRIYHHHRGRMRPSTLARLYSPV